MNFGQWVLVILSPVIYFFSPILFIYSMLFSRVLHQERMFKRLLEREQKFFAEVGRDNIHTLSHPVPDREINHCGLVKSNITLGPSWWQLFIASIHTLFGGNITTYDRLLAHGRSEVLQRLREQGLAEGWDDIVNVRIETAMVMANAGDKRGAFEFIAYGTGIR